MSKGGITLVVTTDYNIYKVGGNGNQLVQLASYPKFGIYERDSRIMLDSRMNLWLFHAHEQANSIQAYSIDSGKWIQPDPLRQMDGKVTVNAMTEDHDGRLWVGTGNHGVLVIDNEITRSVSSMIHITCLFSDRNNTMWVGSAKLGAAFADLNCREFIHEVIGGREDVSALAEDTQGNLWIGFDGYGILMRDKNGVTKTFSALKGQLPSDNITALVTDGHGDILAGTYGGGIARFNGKQFITQYPDYDKLNYIKAITTDRHGSLWVATVDKGVVRITEDGRFTNYKAANSPLRSDGIMCLAYDSHNDRIYIGTNIGLAAYDCSKDCFIENETIDSLKGVNVTALLADEGQRTADGIRRLWIGSRDGLWVKGRNLQHLTTEHGMTNNVVRALAKSDGTVWASTDNGLTCITIQDNVYKFRPFLDSDGLQDIIFSNNAALTTREGTVLLGSLTGYVRIPGDSDGTEFKVAPDESDIHVKFTEFRINGSPVVLPQQDFTIGYGERLGISISMMIPALSHKVRYLYRFKDEDEWMRAPGNMLYFASLMPGKHVLQVKAELPGMTTTNISELVFRVQRPLWLSNFAILGYLLLLTCVGWGVWCTIRRRQKNELAMKQMELNLKKYEMEEQKISFFTNVSHDIKTPLTMVMAPLEKIRDANLPATVRKEIDVAWENARQLYDLVLELLDFRRLDEGKEKLKFSHGELVSFVRKTAQGFNYIAKRRNVAMKMELPDSTIETLFDENKMRRIIINLLSNAFKYNVDGGSVVIGLKLSEATSEIAASTGHDSIRMVQLSVADTGIGIKNKHRVFDRFMQETHGQEQEGSGLGLHIVREYVKMMDGSITVVDNEPTGTVFTVTMPIKIEDKSTIRRSSETIASSVMQDVTSRSLPTILVVDDNTDARLFLQRSLEDEYRVLLATNGKDALSQLAESDDTSIIVSDVMMPIMDGMELVRQIRKDIRYSHIPVILLTAKSGEEDIIAGLEEGVVDYLTKPYSLTVLRLRIRKILEWTRRVHEQVANGIEIKPSEITVSSLDEELINQVVSEIEANINVPTYSVVQLSAAVGMTRGTLYKKLMAIVGKSPVEFIRIVRLKRGKSLLDQGRTNISEVADKVGISPKMFAQYFRETYGKTPTEYIKQTKTKSK